VGLEARFPPSSSSSSSSSTSTEPDKQTFRIRLFSPWFAP
jgi:hypothetical protein